MAMDCAVSCPSLPPTGVGWACGRDPRGEGKPGRDLEKALGRKLEAEEAPRGEEKEGLGGAQRRAHSSLGSGLGLKPRVPTTH